MDNLSELLKEAKPLYMARKKRNSLIKKCALCILPLVICSVAILPFTMQNKQQNSYYTSSESVIEQMGFPTDDYGLLKVD